MIRFGVWYEKTPVALPPAFAKFVAPLRPLVLIFDQWPVTQPVAPIEIPPPAPGTTPQHPPDAHNWVYLDQSVRACLDAGIPGSEIVIKSYFFPKWAVGGLDALTSYDCDTCHANVSGGGGIHQPHDENGDGFCDDKSCRPNRPIPPWVLSSDPNALQFDYDAIRRRGYDLASRYGPQGVTKFAGINEFEFFAYWWRASSESDESCYYTRCGRVLRAFSLGVGAAGPYKFIGPDSYGASGLAQLTPMLRSSIVTTHCYPEARNDASGKPITDPTDQALTRTDEALQAINGALTDQWLDTRGPEVWVTEMPRSVDYVRYMRGCAARGIGAAFFDPTKLAKDGTIDNNTMQPIGAGYEASDTYRELVELMKVPARRRPS